MDAEWIAVELLVPQCRSEGLATLQQLIASIPVRFVQDEADFLAWFES